MTSLRRLPLVLAAALAVPSWRRGAGCNAWDPFCHSNCNCSAFCEGSCAINATQPGTMTTYRMTPPDVLSLDDKNTGDATGDAVFMAQRRMLVAQCRAHPNPAQCGTVLEPTKDVVLELQMEVDGRWGPYLQCNPLNKSDPSGDWQCVQGAVPGVPALPKQCLYQAWEQCDVWDGIADDDDSLPPVRIADVDLDECCAAASSFNSSGSLPCPGGRACAWQYVRANRSCTLYPNDLSFDISKTDHGCVLAYGAGSQPSVPGPPITPCTCPHALRAVGRQAPSQNGTTFTWFSFPSAGRCKDGQTVGDSGCTWRVVEQTSKVDAQCVYDQLDAAVEANDPQCFSTCPRTPGGVLNTTTMCYEQCIFDALESAPLSEAVLRAWKGALDGACPQV